MSPATRLCVYRFDAGVGFDGAIAGALERTALADPNALADALFVTHDAANGDLVAIDLGIAAADGTFASLLDFRLDPARRRRIGRRTLAEHRRGVPPELIRAIGATLDGEDAILVVLHRGDAALLLEAVERAGGRAIGIEPVEAATIGEAEAQLTRMLAG